MQPDPNLLTAGKAMSPRHSRYANQSRATVPPRHTHTHATSLARFMGSEQSFAWCLQYLCNFLSKTMCESGKILFLKVPDAANCDMSGHRPAQTLAKVMQKRYIQHIHFMLESLAWLLMNQSTRACVVSGSDLCSFFASHCRVSIE